MIVKAILLIQMSTALITIELNAGIFSVQFISVIYRFIFFRMEEIIQSVLQCIVFGRCPVDVDE